LNISITPFGPDGEISLDFPIACAGHWPGKLPLGRVTCATAP
jgi:hypothetical protein